MQKKSFDYMQMNMNADKRQHVQQSHRYTVSVLLAGVRFRNECVVMRILSVPALAGEASGRHVHCPPITLPFALKT